MNLLPSQLNMRKHKFPIWEDSTKRPNSMHARCIKFGNWQAAKGGGGYTVKCSLRYPNDPCAPLSGKILDRYFMRNFYTIFMRGRLPIDVTFILREAEDNQEAHSQNPKSFQWGEVIVTAFFSKLAFLNRVTAVNSLGERLAFLLNQRSDPLGVNERLYNIIVKSTVISTLIYKTSGKLRRPADRRTIPTHTFPMLFGCCTGGERERNLIFQILYAIDELC